MRHLSIIGSFALALSLATTGCSADGSAEDDEARERAAQQGDKLAQASSDPKPAERASKMKPAETETASEADAKGGEENPLLDPKSAAMTEKAPSEFRVRFETSAGEFEIDVTRAWAPRGADRFYNLVRHGFYDGCRFFRVVPNFMVQFGINGDPALSAVWATTQMLDDPVKESNQRGFITYAKTGAPNSRSTQLFISHKDNSFLDPQGFAPFGKVVGKGMDVVDAITAEFGERPNQGLITSQGNAYLEKQFPKLDYIEHVTVVEKPAG